MRRALDPALLVALAALIWVLQYTSGAYSSDFTVNEDEPAHVVSSLMVRDYVANAFPTTPLRFAANYYAHYPKVAIGHWPPVFYVTEAAWMLVFGRSKAAMLVLVALAGCALCAAVFLWVKRDGGPWVALLCAALLATMHVTRVATYSVAPDILLALFIFLAAGAYGVYLETHDRRYLIAFGILALACVGTHGRGLGVALIPVVASALQGRLFRNPSRLLLTAVIGAAAVWLAVTVGQSYPISTASVVENAGTYAYQLAAAVGWPVAMIAPVGVWFAVRDGRGRWIAMTALLISMWVFHAVMNVPIGKHYGLTAMPAVLVLFALAWIGLKRMAIANVGFALTGCILIGINMYHVAIKPDLRIHAVAQEILNSAPGNVILVAGDPLYEGALISEAALLDPNQTRILLRASKVLSHDTWSRKAYLPSFANADQTAEYLDQVGAGLLVLQSTLEPVHMSQLAEVTVRNPQRWSEVPLSPARRDLRVYRRSDEIPKRATPIRIDLRDRIGRFIEIQE